MGRLQYGEFWQRTISAFGSKVLLVPSLVYSIVPLDKALIMPYRGDRLGILVIRVRIAAPC